METLSRNQGIFLNYPMNKFFVWVQDTGSYLTTAGFGGSGCCGVLEHRFSVVADSSGNFTDIYPPVCQFYFFGNVSNHEKILAIYH